jgi:polysaccharide chain length determinant protein (PEP-CTERM system associated)
MLPGKKYSPDEVIRVLVSRRWLLVLPAVLGLVLGIAASHRIPKTYRSETLILVVPPRIPEQIVPRNPETVAERLNTINDVILSRSRLERIIRDLNLHNYQNNGAIMEDIVQRMRTDEIQVKIEGKESFRVSYLSDTAKTAQMVTDRLASLYIEENLKDQATLAQNTNQFLESQLEEARQRLMEQERRVEEYKNRHAGQLPSQQQANLQSIQNAQLQMQANSESTNRARERRILIERQLADAQTLPVPSRPADTNSTSDATVLTTAQQLEIAQARLAAYRQRYTPEHPDIKALERSIEELQKKAEDEDANATLSAKPKPVSVAEAARQRQISELKAQLEAIDLQISSNLREEGRLKGVIADYQGKVNAVPARESEMVELTRDYTTMSDSYYALLKKHQDAKLAESLVRGQIGEQFKILDPASLPHKPYNSTQRLIVLAAGPALGLLIGLGLVVLIEFRDSTFKTETEVGRILAIPVLALVPTLASERERRRTKTRIVLVDLAGTAVVVVTATVLILWRLRS